MYDLSRLVALLLSFCLGFGSCGGVITGGIALALGTFKVRDIETKGKIDIPDEVILGENPQVDILDLTVFGLIDEVKELQNLGDEVNINLLQTRYDLKIHPDIDKILTDDAREMPLKQLMSSEGVAEIFKNVFIGNIENYECHRIDNDEIADPALGKGETRWYDPVSEEYITGIGETIAFFTLGDFLGGGINVDSVLHGIVLADVLGYTFELDEYGNKIWYDSNEDKVTGLMAIFADCTIDEVATKVNTVKIGEFLSYEQHEEGVWYEYDSVSDTMVPVSGFMNKIANSSISGTNNIGGVFNTLTIGDIVKEEDMQSGLFSIIPADTEITKIGEVVNDSISDSDLQFFMNQGLITFGVTQQKSLDDLCDFQNKVVPYSADDADFIKYYKDKGEWKTDTAGNYLIPEWRTQPLGASFSYIVGLLTPALAEET